MFMDKDKGSKNYNIIFYKILVRINKDIRLISLKEFMKKKISLFIIDLLIHFDE
jgi:hypothetical protein